MLKRSILWLQIGVLGAAMSSQAQTHYFRNYSVAEGLPFVWVSAVCQDSRGFLWTGGYGGISRFDGEKFISITQKDGLADYLVTSIVEDASGNLWAGTAGGLSRVVLHPVSGLPQHIRNYTEADGLGDNYITALAAGEGESVYAATKSGLYLVRGDSVTPVPAADGREILSLARDSKGNLWAGARSGLYAYNGNTAKHFTSADGLPGNNVHALYADRSGYLWIGTDHGVSRVSITNTAMLFEGGEEDQKLFITYPDDQCAPEGKVNAFAEDARGRLWVAGDAGLCRYDDVKGFRPYRIGRKTSANLAQTLLRDYEGNLWIGTYEGLFRHRGDRFVTYDEAAGIVNPFVFGILRDSRGTLWAGTQGGLFYEDPSSPGVFGKTEGLPGLQVWCVMENDDGKLWIGTDAGLTIYDRYGSGAMTNYRRADGLAGDSVNSIIRDSKGDIWMGHGSGVTLARKTAFGYRFTTLPGSTAKKVRGMGVWALMEDRRSRIWVGSYLGGLHVYDGNRLEDYGRRLNLRTNAFMALLQDDAGHIYIGTLEGLFVYDGKEVTHIGEADGLASNLVWMLSFSKTKDALWIGSNQGVSRLDLTAYRKDRSVVAENYGREEGFLGLECNSLGGFADSDGAMWFGTVNGLIRHDPAEAHPNTANPKVRITGFRLYYRDTMLAPGVSLAYDQNHLTFRYACLSFANPDKVLYRYRLTGFDGDWSPPAAERSVTYSNLRPGSYTFEVMAANNDGVWSAQPAIFPFRITAPFWLTWWFRLGTALAVIGAAGAVVRYRLQKHKREERARAEEEIRIAGHELKALRAQMNPHFIFNSLNSIQHFVLNNRDEAASAYLNKFAKLMRSILANSEKTTVPIAQEMEALRLYLELEELRFEDKFTYEINVDGNLDTNFHEIPSMILQPYVENAILHGLVPGDRKGLLKVTVSKEDRGIVFTVTDNGIGRKRSAALKEGSTKRGHKSMGMKLSGERMETLNRILNTSMQVHVTDLEDETGNTVTRVEIVLPIA